MGQDSTEQQELTDTVSESQSVTYQEKIIGLYNSNRLLYVAIGFWAKLLIEAFIVFFPLALVLLVPGAVIVYLNPGLITYSNVITIWVAFSTTILAFSWCLTEPANLDGEEEDESGA